MPGLAQKEPLHDDVSWVLLLSAAVMVVGWVRLQRTLGLLTGVGIPGEGDQKAHWCHQGHPGQKVTINFMKMILVLGWSPVLRNWTQGKKEKGSFYDYRCHWAKKQKPIQMRAKAITVLLLPHYEYFTFISSEKIPSHFLSAN